MKTILVSVDLSAATVHVCNAAADLAAATGGRLVILHVVPPFPSTLYAFDTFSAAQITGYERAARKSAAHKMQALQRWFNKRCPGTRMLLHDGACTEVILKTAGRLHANYLVIGSHGHGAMHDLLAGSTARGILRKAACPVVLVPIPQPTGKGRQATRRQANTMLRWT
jgi:nucleotide-binding universal stress UspA family protein